MGTSNLIPGHTQVASVQATGSITGATAYLGISKWAQAWGRGRPKRPYNGSLVDKVITQVAQNVFTVDDIGATFPSGTLWIRTQSTSIGANDGDSDGTWIAVPDTLPAGYTARNRRNVRPGCDLMPGSRVQGGSLVHIYETGYSSANSLPIRTADGVYTPRDFGNTRNWGPSNLANTTSQFGSGGSAIGIPRESFLSYHPGFRQATVQVQWGAADYAAINPATVHRFTIAGTNYDVPRSSLVLDVPSGQYRYTFTVTSAALLAPLGTATILTWFNELLNTGLPNATTFPGYGWSAWLSPRVDIPAPWTATCGDLVAPGGILTGGNIPGY